MRLEALDQRALRCQDVKQIRLLEPQDHKFFNDKPLKLIPIKLQVFLANVLTWETQDDIQLWIKCLYEWI